MLRGVVIVAPVARRSFHSSARLQSNLVPGSEAHAPRIQVRDVGRSGVSGITATVFGCTGFVGRYVVALLGRVGAQVIVPYRGDGMNVRPLKLAGDLGQIVPVPFTTKDPQTIRRAVERSNVVINLLGSDRETRNFSFKDIHVTIPEMIASIAKEAGAERVIQLSALGATEDSPSKWLASKAKGEKALRNVFPDATIFRPCTIFGRDDRFLNRYAQLAASFPFIPILEGGRQKLQPVFVENVAAAILNSLNTKDAVGATYELGGPRVYTLEEILEFIFETTYHESNTVTLPLPIAKIYGSIIQRLPNIVSPLTADQVVRMQIDSTVSSSPAADNVKTFADLEIFPTRLEDVASSVLFKHRKYVEKTEDF